MTVRAISYGGGVQSTAMLVLAARGKIDFRLALFSNVGDDSEHPDTLEYVANVASPYAEKHGLELRELRKVRKDGTEDTLMKQIDRVKSTIPIPMRMANGAPGNRSCTGDFKIKVVARELKRLGATRAAPAVLALGISLDEYQRMRTDSGIPHETFAYPLIDLRMDRQDCINLIRSEGLPVPPKSSCFFCPFHTINQWRELMRARPDLFQKSVEMERAMNERRAALGKDPMWMSTALKPLDEAVTENGQLDMFEPGCQIAGYCHI